MRHDAQLILEGFEKNSTVGSEKLEFQFLYTWGNNTRRATYKGRHCRILAFGRMRSVLIEFENGERTITSQRA
ncbi:MAG: hypothetical protein MN733_26915, partial [Nitrososphaera sp.]|nr:hypothetical protein [Nitrososphaera sp.]